MAHTCGQALLIGVVSKSIAAMVCELYVASELEKKNVRRNGNFGSLSTQRLPGKIRVSVAVSGP